VALNGLPEVPDDRSVPAHHSAQDCQCAISAPESSFPFSCRPPWDRAVALLVVALPAVALAQSGSPFDTGFTNLQTLFTGTIAKVASLIAIVIGGYQFAHGEPGAKKTPELNDQSIAIRV
jgi:hypothetical protein